MSHGWYTCDCGIHYHESEHSSGGCKECSSKVVNLFQEKTKKESIFNFEQAAKDVEHYAEVVSRSVDNFHTYSVQQKQQLYSDLAEFNIRIVRELLEIKKNEHQ